MKTFTDVDYRMFGPGTYILVVAGNTVIQGKFERNPVSTESKCYYLILTKSKC